MAKRRLRQVDTLHGQSAPCRSEGTVREPLACFAFFKCINNNNNNNNNNNSGDFRFWCFGCGVVVVVVDVVVVVVVVFKGLWFCLWLLLSLLKTLCFF